jgi:hypothetical protein
LTTIYSFSGAADGGDPTGGVVQHGGHLFGVARSGGYSHWANGQYGLCQYWDVLHGCGVVYQLTPPVAGSAVWTETTLYVPDYTSGSTTTGPFAGGLIVDSHGALFGAMQSTETITGVNPIGAGSLYKLVPSTVGDITTWTFQTLREFSGQGDGRAPVGSLVADASGALYGVTFQGGVVSHKNGDPCNGWGCGTVFKLTGSGYQP